MPPAEPIEQLLRRLAEGGFRIVTSTPERIVLARTNPWRAVILGAALGAFSGAHPLLRRHEQVVVRVTNGLGVVLFPEEERERGAPT